MAEMPDLRPFDKATLTQLLGESHRLREQCEDLARESAEVELEISKRFRQSRDADRRRPSVVTPHSMAKD